MLNTKQTKNSSSIENSEGKKNQHEWQCNKIQTMPNVKQNLMVVL